VGSEKCTGIGGRGGNVIVVTNKDPDYYTSHYQWSLYGCICV